jgi:predicted RNase H-like HicB family nuclease
VFDFNGFYLYDIPDFNSGTQGRDLTEAIEIARDALGILGISIEDDGDPLPVPSSLSSIVDVKDSNIVTLVNVDFTKYRKDNDLRAVRKNCTLPAWLHAAAERAGLNYSALLQAAIKRELRISET